MKTSLIHSGLIITATLFAALAAEASGEIPEELRTPNYRITKLEGIGYDAKLTRQDPSNVIKVGDLYYVWYTQRQRGVHAYASTVYYATSKDGLTWKDKGEAIGKGEKGQWDSFGVITPYVGVFNGKYYLHYTGTSAERGFQSRGPDGTLRHIGIAIADNPDGPWKKFERNPVFSPVEGDNWEDLLVDDAHVIARDGKYWLYYKGGHRTVKPSDTKWGLATSDKPTGPFVRYRANPLIGGHTVCIWPHRKGVAALIDKAGPESHSVQWSTDGVHFNCAAKLKVVHTGCGPYDPDAFTDTGYGRGITWGVAQYPEKGTLCIVRFDVDLGVPKDASDFSGLPLDLTTIRSAPANASGLDDRQPTNWERHDPSNIIKYQGKYLLWVTEHARGNGFSDTRIILLSSSDGLDWRFEQIALDKNSPGYWDDGGVLTSYVVPYNEKFYLFYTGVNTAFTNSGKDRRGIGYAVSPSPYGPWKRPSANQIIFAGEIGQWDELCADDANVICWGGKWYLYYKGRKIGSSSSSSQVGLAISDTVTGPYVRYQANPLFKGHASTVTKHGDGLLAFPGANNQRVLWSPDGIHFVAGAGLKHKSTGVCNPADFEADSKNGHIDWLVNVIAASPRKLHRINLIYDAENGSRQ